MAGIVSTALALGAPDLGVRRDSQSAELVGEPGADGKTPFVLGSSPRAPTPGSRPRPRPDMGRVSTLLDAGLRFFIFNALMSAYVAIPPKLAGATLASGEQNIWYTGTHFAVLLCVVAFCAWNPGRILSVAARTPLLNLFVVFAALSVAWSMAPMVSSRRVVTLATAVAYAYYIVATGRVGEAIRTIAVTTVIAGIVSAALALAWPKIGQMSADDFWSPELVGAWSGVFTHKNELGINMLVGAQACAWIALTDPKRRWLGLLGALICAAVIFQSRSRTAEIGVLSLPLLLASLRLLRLPGLALLWAVFAVAVLGVIGAAASYADFGALMGAIGKDASMTGRLPLWSEVLNAVRERPLQGYGYMAFFVDGNSRMVAIQRSIGWPAPDVHQGYLDLLLQLGVPGFWLGVAVFGSATIRSLVAVRAGGPAWASFAAVNLITCLWTNTAESGLWYASSIYAVLLPLAYAGLRVERAAQPGPAPCTAGPFVEGPKETASDFSMLTDPPAIGDLAR